MTVPARLVFNKGGTLVDIEPVSARSGGLISRARVKRFLLDRAAVRRHHTFTRVSRETLDRVEGRVREMCARIVDTAPSKGVTL